jgi:hypothetical protein
LVATSLNVIDAKLVYIQDDIVLCLCGQVEGLLVLWYKKNVSFSSQKSTLWHALDRAMEGCHNSEGFFHFLLEASQSL